MKLLRCGTLVVGGGIAGLWTAAQLAGAGHDVRVLDVGGLGRGQSVACQGIVHGGGKYTLRGVKDFAAARAIRDMPQRWRDALAAEHGPKLSSVALLSDSCWLWLPRGSWIARVEAIGLMPFLQKTGVLAAPPRARKKKDWPKALQNTASAAYEMAEPVFSAPAVLDALASQLVGRVHRYSPELLCFEAEGERWQAMQFREAGESVRIEAGHFLLSAGAGNATLLEAAGLEGESRMQRRPLLMGLVRGPLPELHGHCIRGGKTRITVTTAAREGAVTVWQLGGEIAERWAGRPSSLEFLSELQSELLQWLPGLDLSGCEFSSYVAIRAEGARSDQRRPSGIQREALATNADVAWPTKWALAPILADEIEDRVGPAETIGSIDSPGDWSILRAATVASPPWEGVSWSRASLV